MDSLNPNTSYEELVSVRLAGMMLVIIVRQELRKNVLRYSTQSVGTGALNFWVKHNWPIDRLTTIAFKNIPILFRTLNCYCLSLK